MAMNGYSTLLRFPELEPYLQMSFSVILRESLFKEGVFTLFREYRIQHILSPTDRVRFYVDLLNLVYTLVGFLKKSFNVKVVLNEER